MRFNCCCGSPGAGVFHLPWSCCSEIKLILSLRLLIVAAALEKGLWQSWCSRGGRWDTLRSVSTLLRSQTYFTLNQPL